MKKLMIIALASLALGGCYAGVPTMYEAPGLLYADYKAGKDAEGAVGGKTGRACNTSILGLIGLGDSSIQAAAANGGIATVTSVDRTAKNILGVYAEYCTVVTGK